MQYTKEVEEMVCVAKGPNHGPAPIPEEGKWIQAKEIKDISGYTHGIGWCAPQQGGCKLSLNVKDGIIEEALVETIGCSGMTHSAAMASEILPGKTLLEALNTDLVCDAINTAMRELFLQIVYGRTQSAFSENGLRVGAGLEDLGKGLRSMVGTMYGTRAKGVRYLEMTEGYCVKMALDKDDQVCGYQFLSLGKMMDDIGFKDFEEVKAFTNGKGVDAYTIVEGTQPICFENVKWAYELGAAIAMKEGATTAADAAKWIGVGLQAFCIPGSVADQRQVGIGHGNLGAMLLDEGTECFAFLAGHESFAAAEGAIKIALNANKVRTKPLRVILNGLGKDAAMIISRINGFTYVQTKYDYLSADVKEDHALTIVSKTAYSDGPRAAVNCYGADDVREGVAIMWHEDADVSITGNSTNPTRFQHPVAGTYKKERTEAGRKYFSVASGGGTGRTLHPDNMAAGPASYGMTDTLGRMHSDAQFAGSSSVPAHVEMMGFLGAGNNPMVGMTVAVAVAVQQAMNK